MAKGGSSRSGGARGAKSAGKTRTIAPAKKGQKAITFKQGGLHASTKTPAGRPISPAMHAAARAGRLGPKAQQQESFYENVLKRGGK